MRARKSSVGPLTERDTEVDRESPPPAENTEGQPLIGIAEEEDDEARELRLMRTAFRKWCRKARVQAQAGGEEDGGCDWTKPIKPMVEGRIVMLGEGSS